MVTAVATALINPASAANIGFVVGNASGLTAFDSSWISRLQSPAGGSHTVFVIDDDTLGTNPVYGNSFGLFIVSSSVNSGAIRDATKLGLSRAVPYIVYEQVNFPDFFGGGQAAPAANPHIITISNAGSPLATGLSGNVTIYSGNSQGISTSNGSRSPNATVVANRNGIPGDVVLLVLEANQQGGTNGTTTFPARRIGVPCQATWTFANVTTDGLKILDNAVAYALPFIAPFPKLAVAFSPILPVLPGDPIVAGTVFDITITAKDANDLVFDDNVTPVSISGVGSNPAGSLMEFDWDGNGTYGDSSGTLVNGVKTIKARNTRAQTVTLTATAGTTTTPAPPDVITVPGPYTQLQILAPGETAAPGTPSGKTGTPSVQILNQGFFVTVSAVDSNWNAVPTAVADPSISITSSDPLATLPPAELISVNSSVYAVTLNTAPGSFTVTANDAVNTIQATTPPLTVFGIPITWVGDGVDNFWDTTSPNWSGALPNTYADPSQVTFDTNGSLSPAVSIVGTVSPSKVTVDLTIGNSYTFAGSGQIASVPGGFIKTGAGSLTISTANTYSGPTTVSGGLLIPTTAGSLPSTSAVTLNGGLIGVQDINFVRPIGLAAGGINLVNGGFAAFGTSGVVNLGGNVTPDLLTMGSPEFLAGGAAGTFVLGHIDATRAIELQNPIALRGGTNFFQIPESPSAVDAILSGAISAPFGGSGLSKTGDGVLMLTNTGNTFNQSFIDNGTIILGVANVLPDGATFTVKKGNSSGAESVLDLNGFSDSIGTLNFGDNGAGNSGTPSVINSDISTPEKAAAVLTINGALNYNAGNASAYGQATISANLDTGTAGNRTITVANSSGPDDDLVISGALSGGAITKAGAGVLVLTNPVYSGNTTVSVGRLTVRKTAPQTNANPNNDASTITITAGAVLSLEYAGTDTVASLVIGANPPLASGIYGATDFPGAIAGAGTITVVADPYLTWAVNGAAFSADTNNDSVKNGLAWFLGAANKEANANGLLPLSTQNAGGLVLEFNCLDATARGTAIFQLQHSSDLGQLDSWAGAIVPGAVGSFNVGVVGFEVTDPAPPGGLLKVVATIPVSEAAAGKLFGRIDGQR